VADLFELCYAKAVRLAMARGSLGEADAQDVVSGVFESIWTMRHYFDRPPSPAYVYRATVHTAWRRRQYAWHRYVVLMAPETLVLAEQAMYDPAQPALAGPPQK
jgi:DNA-directed RNA polymerase specialized sigma24 family protein